MHCIWTERAVQDLENIQQYCNTQGSADAGRLILLTILAAGEAIAEMPLRGREGRVAGTRELVIRDTPFIIAYRPGKPRPEILAVIHGARLWPESL